MLYSEIPESSPFTFERVSHITRGGELKFAPHYHNYFEIYYVEKGCCNYFIDNKSYSISVGDFVLIPEGIIHNTLYRENRESIRILINCARWYVPKSAESVFSKRNYLYRNHDATPELFSLLKKIEAEFNSADKFSASAIQCYMNLFFFTMARNPNQYKSDAPQSSYIESAINYIQENFTSEISLSDISERFSVSCEHFSRKFKKETGFGFCEYVNLLRMKKAELLLKQQKELTVAQVAAVCGFSDSNYFSVKFKKMYSISPGALKKNSN